MGMKTVRNDFRDEDLNPCIEEGKLTNNCLKENFYDSNKCVYYFENYRNCARFWASVKRLRMRRGIQPPLPGKEEREKILKERQKGNYVYQAT